MLKFAEAPQKEVIAARVSSRLRENLTPPALASIKSRAHFAQTPTCVSFVGSARRTAIPMETKAALPNAEIGNFVIRLAARQITIRGD